MNKNEVIACLIFIISTNFAQAFDLDMTVDDEIRKKWFITRAVEERNQDIENALKHWDYITEAGQKYVKPYRREADMIINGKADLKYFAQILEYIHTITNNFQ